MTKHPDEEKKWSISENKWGKVPLAFLLPQDIALYTTWHKRVHHLMLLLPSHISQQITFLKGKTVWQQETKSDTDQDFGTAFNLCSIPKVRSCTVNQLHATPQSIPSPKGQFDKMVKNSPEHKTYYFQWRHWEVQPLLNNTTTSCHLVFFFSFSSLQSMVYWIYEKGGGGNLSSTLFGP